MAFIGKVKIWTQNLKCDACTVNHTTATLIDQCLVLPFPDRPRTNVEEGTSLCSGILERDVEGYKKMLCLSLRRWWNKLVCQGVNCENPGHKDQNREKSLHHWEKLQCEKRNLSVGDCSGSTQECLSLTLIRCSGEQTLLGEHPQSLHCFSFVLII